MSPFWFRCYHPWQSFMLSSLGIPTIVVIIAQVITGVHAYRNGKFFWIFLIIFVPVLGILIYFFAEMLPSMRVDRTFQSAGTQVVNTLQPTRRLQQLEEMLEEQDTMATRQAYAEELMRHERVDEAIEVLEGGLRGVFANDPQGMLALAQAYHQKGEHARAQALLDAMQEESPGFEPDTVRLLRARTRDEQGFTEEALEDYRALAQRGYSEEPRYYLALALDKLGRDDEAKEVLEQAQKYLSRSSNIYRRENQGWTKQLKQHFGAKDRG